MKKTIRTILLFTVLIVAIMLFTLIMYLFIVKAQETVLVPENYVLWTFNYPFSILILLYPFLLIIGLFEVLKKGPRKAERERGLVSQLRRRSTSWLLFVVATFSCYTSFSLV